MTNPEQEIIKRTTSLEADSLPVDPLESSLRFFEDGQLYPAFRTWFSMPDQRREQVLQDVFIEATKYDTAYRYLEEKASTSLERFAFRYLTVISSDKAKKLFTAQKGEPLSDIDVMLGDEEEEALATLVRILKPHGIDPRDRPFSARVSDGDFKGARALITQHFSVDDMSAFLKHIFPGAKKGSQFYYPRKGELPGLEDFVDPMRHADLLLDEDAEVSAFVERSVLYYPLEWDTHLYNYLSQGIFPHAKFFEKAFEKRPEIVDAYSVSMATGRELPTAAFYFTMLRRIVHAREFGDPQERRNGRIVEYLLSDAFMEHALFFLETEEVYGDPDIGDLFIREGRGHRAYYAYSIEATGEEAKIIKMRRLGEVIRAAVAYAEKKGQSDVVQQLKERRVGTIQFSDFLAA